MIFFLPTVVIVCLKLSHWHLFNCMVQCLSSDRRVEGLDQHLILVKLLCLVEDEEKPGRKTFGWYIQFFLFWFLVWFLFGFFFLRTDAITETCFSEFLAKKAVEAMGVCHCKQRSLFRFPSFSQFIQVILQKLQWALSIWRAPQEQRVCLSFHQPAEMNLSPTGQQHMALLRTSKFPISISSWATCSVGCESWSWHAAATWIPLYHWFSPQCERCEAKCYLW